MSTLLAANWFSKRLWTVILCGGTLIGSLARADDNFKVLNGQWNDDHNWTGGVPDVSTGLTVIINGGTATYDSSMGTMSFGGGEFRIGDGRNGNVPNTLNVTGGTLVHSSGEALVGYGFAQPVTGILNVSGGTFDNQGNTLTVGWLVANTSGGYVNISAGGQVNTGDLRLGSGPGGIGHLDIAASGGTLQTSGLFSVGYDSAAGYLTQEGGTLTSNGTLAVGNSAFGQMTITGGQITANSQLNVGVNGSGQLNISGSGQIAANSDLQLGTDNGTGLVVQTGGSVLCTQWLNIGKSGSASAYQLNGGTLKINRVVSDSTGTLFLNGGTLQATQNSPFFIYSGGGLNVRVQSGGAVIDSNGFSATVAKPLMEDSSSTGGGLTKLGAGTLTLANSNGYTGTTTVSAGTINVTGSLLNNSSNKVFIAAGDLTVGSPTLVRNVSSGASFAGYGSAIVGGLSSAADIRAGQNNNAAADSVSMQWRLRNANEMSPTATSPPLPIAGQKGLISEVLSVMGMTVTGALPVAGRTQADPFALQMNYSQALLGDDATAAAEAANGAIYLGWLNQSVDQPTGLWVHATEGNFSAGSQVFTNVQSSWDAFATAHGVTDANIDAFLGSYGVDAASHTAWAIVNHNSEFAVVPEPSTVVLACLGFVGLIGYATGRRKRAGG